jgi:hypothetical protein
MAMAGTESIAFDTLHDLLEGRVSTDTAHDLHVQLADADARTQRDAAWLQAFTAARAQVTLISPPADLHASLLQVYRPSPLTGLLRQVQALLTFDSAAQMAPMAGVRSAETRSRQMIFACDMAEVAMTVRPSRQADRLDVNGQVFPRDLPSVDALVVQIARADDLLDISLTNDVGEFSFTELPPGAYTLSMSAGDNEVAIEQFDVRLDMM